MGVLLCLCLWLLLLPWAAAAWRCCLRPGMVSRPLESLPTSSSAAEALGAAAEAWALVSKPLIYT